MSLLLHLGGVEDLLARRSYRRPIAGQPVAAGVPVEFAGAGHARYDLIYATVADNRDLTLDLFTPLPSRWPGPRPLIVYVHGGAFAMFSKKAVLPTVGWRSPARIFVELVERGYAVASIDYRLSGEAQYPLPLYDVKAAVRWLRAHAGDNDLDPDRFIAWGESAGGWFSAMLAATGDVAELEGAQGVTGVSSRVQAAVDWYGPTDFVQMDRQLVSPVMLRHDVAGSPEALFLGQVPSHAPELSRAASPLTYVAADCAPMLIQHGALDHIVPPGQSCLLDEALTRAGIAHQAVLYPGADHMFLGYGFVFSRRILATFFDFLDTHGQPG